jgi:signal transduction histidine kinase
LGIVTNADTCLRLLAEDPPNLDGARDTARRTLRDGDRAAAVITRLRALFKKKGVGTETFDVNEAIQEVLALMRSEFNKSRIALQTELASDVPLIVGDRVQFQQVMLNLILNACEAMSGVVGRQRQLVITTQLHDGDHVQIAVRDSGAGLDPATRDRIFQPFYTSKSEGMGMGLSISRSIVERHRGRLRAESNDGPGATFVFTIPRAPIDASAEMQKLSTWRADV